MKLSDRVSAVKGVGPQLEKTLVSLGIITVRDLLDYYPRRYDDYSNVVQIRSVKPGAVTLKVVIKQTKGRYVRGGLHITEAVISDATGSLRAVWFNQPYRAASVRPGVEYYVSGKLELKRGRLVITNPSTELVSEVPINAARIIPIYPERKKLTSRKLRTIISNALEATYQRIPETLPEQIITSNRLMKRRDAVYNKHFPDSQDTLQDANERLGFEELFELILASQYSRREINQQKAVPIGFDLNLAKRFVKSLPFTLTSGQRKAVWQIFKDIESKAPMNRLLEGDVGSGKTAVAAMATAMTMHNDYQVAFMAPTEILARQHADSMQRVLDSLGYGDKVGLLVGGMKKLQKDNAREDIRKGNIKCIVGTHALIQENIDMHSLGLVIIDEQHRFGVKQRQQLLKKAGHIPHMLSMTATPIPRSLALTVFGEIDVSILDEKPKNRQEIVTKIIDMTERLRVYTSIDSQLDAGRQMFVVCPLIEETDKTTGRSAEKVFQELKHGHFAKRRIGLMHGKMKPEDKQAVMNDFLSGVLDILVSTTVIEVGVDVPNATVMMIESPERFGLAQLHQLRGRVGRGAHLSYCYLMRSESGQISERLQAIESTNDGFELAELDLRLRGAGALYGTSQHGILDLRVADFTDIKLIARARSAALNFLENNDNLLQYTHIKKRILELQHVVHLN